MTFERSEALAALMRERRSCRAFRPDPVPREVLSQLFAMAQRSPSWCNTQPWEVTITVGDATERLRNSLREHAATPGTPDIPFPECYTGVYDARRKVCGGQLYESVGIVRGDREASLRQTMRNFEFFGAPHLLVITTAPSLGAYGAIDCGVYVGNLLLAAESLGLGAIPQAALAMYSEFLRSHLDLGPDRNVVCGVSLGYADDDDPANGFVTQRADVDDVVTFLDR